ncbi:MAG: M1 family metallopeptidase [Polyangiaceae bacterium]
MNALDPHSFARLSEVRVRHVDLELEVDFERRVVRGAATLHATGAGRLVLDTRRLTISSVTRADGAAVTWTLGADDELLGAPLTIDLADGAAAVRVEYETSRGAPALDWLAPEQTLGGEHPFLFTQGHAIEARSWMPIQDSPAVRVTYAARITVPAPLLALMSAERTGVAPSADGQRITYSFRMEQPIPAYLFALAVGRMGHRETGPRTGVFAELPMLDRAAEEFAELERMLGAAEPLGGPYRWDRFDVVVMPPSFPYGGMENPRLTFASPTLIAGDRSLTTVVVHELAHAWAGNLVTNATWDDFWLNEGTTVYLELRLNELLWGRERAEFLKAWSFRELAAAIENMGATSPDTRLAYEMRGRDPAVGVTLIPYLKGAAFFWTLEDLVGRERLDPWLRGWFERHAFVSVTARELIDDVRTHLLRPTDPPIDLERWVHAPGMPDTPPPTSHLLEQVDSAARAWVAGEPASALEARGVARFTPQAWRHFLGVLLASPPEAARVRELDAAFALSKSHNAEILAPWLRLEARAHEGESAIEAFLSTHGRLKYVRPLYVELCASDWGKPIAKRIYARARPRYHALVRGNLDKLLG